MNDNRQYLPIRTFRSDLSIMSQYNTPGDGQTQAIASCLAAAGLVCAVKAVKQVGQFILSHWLG